MAVTVAWGTKVISFLQSDLTLDGAAPQLTYELDVDWMREQLHAQQASIEGVVEDEIFNHNPPVSVGGIELGRVVEIINGYTLAPEDTGTPYFIKVIGGNTNFADVAVLTANVSWLPQNSAGLIVDPLTTDAVLQSVKYGGAIWFDATNGTAGQVVGTNGTFLNPSDNEADIQALQAATGIKTTNIRGEYSLSSAHTDETFRGLSADAEVVCNGYDMDNSRFEDLVVRGGCAGGRVELLRCQLNGFTNWWGVARECVVKGTMNLAAEEVVFQNCSSWVAGSGSPIAGFQTNTVVQFRGWTGSVTLRSMSSGNVSSVDLVTGRVIVEAATNTGGTLVVRGVGEVEDYASAAVSIDKQGLIDPIKAHLVSQMVAGNVYVTGGGTGIEVRDEDNVTILATFTIANGAADQTRVT